MSSVFTHSQCSSLSSVAVDTARRMSFSQQREQQDEEEEGELMQEYEGENNEIDAEMEPGLAVYEPKQQLLQRQGSEGGDENRHPNIPVTLSHAAHKPVDAPAKPVTRSSTRQAQQQQQQQQQAQQQRQPLQQQQQQQHAYYQQHLQQQQLQQPQSHPQPHSQPQSSFAAMPPIAPLPAHIPPYQPQVAQLQQQHDQQQQPQPFYDANNVPYAQYAQLPSALDQSFSHEQQQLGLSQSSQNSHSSLAVLQPSQSQSQPQQIEGEPSAPSPCIGVQAELQEEIIAHMRAHEHQHRVWSPDARYLKHRRIIVDWMCEVGEEFHLLPITIHTSVRYLDRVLGAVDVPKNRLQLVAMACLLLATKHEEQEDAVPTLHELNECSNFAYSVELIREMEIAILRQLQWQLNQTTTIHFLHMYQAKGLLCEQDTFEGGPSSRRAALRYVKKYSDFFSELCLQEYGFCAYLPSLLAAAVIAAARRAVKIDPIWNAELTTLTGVNEQQIFQSYKQLYDYYIDSFPNAPHAAPSAAVLEFERRGSTGIGCSGINHDGSLCNCACDKCRRRREGEGASCSMSDNGASRPEGASY